MSDQGRIKKTDRLARVIQIKSSSAQESHNQEQTMYSSALSTVVAIELVQERTQYRSVKTEG